MATSNSYSNDFRAGSFRLRAYWVSSQNNAGNYDLVDVYLYLESISSSAYISSSSTKYGTLNIAGEDFSFSFTAGISTNQSKQIAHFQKTVYHDADGSKWLSVSASIGLNLTLSGTYYGTISVSGGDWLNQIARYPTVGLGYVGNTGLGATLSWTSSMACDALQYTINGGSTWNNLSVVSPFSISGLAYSTYYSLQIRAKASVSQLWGYSNTIYFTTNVDPTPTVITHLGIAGTTYSSITLDITTDAVIDAMQYKLFTSTDWSTLPSNKSIAGLVSNTTYGIKIRVKRTSNQVWTESTIIYATTKQSNFVGYSYNGGAFSLKPFKMLRTDGSITTFTKNDIMSIQKGIRYIKIGSQGNNVDDYNHIVECQVFDANGVNLALNKIVTSPIVEDTTKPLSNVVNGDITANSYAKVGCSTLIDLGATYEVAKVKLFRYFGDNRVYNNTYVYGYNDLNELVHKFHDYKRDGTYQETAQGKEFL